MSVTESSIIGVDDTILVTGANGFIGVRVVKALLDCGFRRIRCFVRPSGDLTRLQELLAAGPSAHNSIEIVEGNLLLPPDCERAAAGVSVILHLAAGMEKSFAACFMNSVLTTRNLLDAAVGAGTLKRFVNVSSFAVYSLWNVRRGSTVDESTGVETRPQERFDPYGYAKLKQDELLQTYDQRFGIPYVILRPGVVFGPGKKQLTGRVGIDTFGVFLHMGGSNRIPFTYVDNCADAIVRAGMVPGIDGHIFNVVDDDVPTSRRFLRLYKRHGGWFPSIPVPFTLAYLLSSAWERYSAWSEGQLPPRFNRRRALAEWGGHRYSNEKLKQLVGWSPRVSFDDAVRTYFQSLAA
jgi:nucleoside-diphosphate-sugar epimerase